MAREGEEFLAFSRQDPALEYIAKAGCDYRIFSRERNANGSRIHQVYPSCVAFWEAYKNYDQEYRTFYEVIPTGHPAKLYFDLEFAKDLNPDSDGPFMVDILVVEVGAALQREFPSVSHSMEVIKLDSSTPAKFSQHVIFPDIVFRDLGHVKVCVQRLYSHIDKIIHQMPSNSPDSIHNNSLKLLQINTINKPSLFVDTSVYGRKQNFRIFLSSKFGKNNHFRRPDNESSDRTDQEIFLHSLITNTSHVPPKKCLAYPINDAFRPYNDKFSQKMPVLISGTCPSPFLEIDSFFLRFMARENERSGISRWEYQEERKVLRYFTENDYQICDKVHGDLAVGGGFFLVFLKTSRFFSRCMHPACSTARPDMKTLPLTFTG